MAEYELEKQEPRIYEEALADLEKKTSEVSILYEFAARPVFPLDQFAARLAEIMHAEMVEVLLLEQGELKTAAAYGLPAPAIAPSTLLDVPLLHEDKKIGALRLTCFARKEFGANEKRLLSIIADRLTQEIVHQKMEVERKEYEQKLKQKIDELEQFHDLTVGRELKMMELEKEINALLAELGREPKY